MSYMGLDRLAKLSKLNANAGWVNEDLYRLMYREELYVIAYEAIKSQPGNMTPGIDKSTLDGISLEKTIRPIIEKIRSEQFQFSKGRRIYIPKASGSGMRPLTIAPPREKVVQEVIRMILDAIFDSEEGPTFMESSHGFRRGRGTHSALETIRKSWVGTRWIIEGDIKGCFDNIDHHILIDLLRKRIKDERFLNLIWKALKAGYMEDGIGFGQDVGSPQGSIISPILANVYLHELDVFVERLRLKYERGEKRKWNSEYRQLQRRKTIAESNGNRELASELAIRMRSIPSHVMNDPDYIRIRYVRYADDWIVGVIGPTSLATTLKEEIRRFLRDSLNLTLSEEKTHIRHAGTEQAKFLGTLVGIQGGGNAMPKVSTIVRNGRTFRKRVTGWLPTMNMPTADVVKQLHQKGFCTVNGEPLSKTAWINLSHEDILMQYNATLRGVSNYYAFVDNRSQIARIQYILQHSAAKTLANKFRLRSRANTFKKFGKRLTARTEMPDGSVRETQLWLLQNFRREPNRFLRGEQKAPLTEVWNRRLTRSHLGSPCCICGSDSNVEMHHVRHVRKSRGRSVGFQRVMGLINRKQIPTCSECHGKIHRGEYDGLELGQFAFNPARSGIKAK